MVYTTIASNYGILVRVTIDEDKTGMFTARSPDLNIIVTHNILSDKFHEKIMAKILDSLSLMGHQPMIVVRLLHPVKSGGFWYYAAIPYNALSPSYIPFFNMQSMVDAINESDRITRSKFMLTIDKMIPLAQEAEGVVRFADGGSPGKANSYCDYYSDLAFSLSDRVRSAQSFYVECVESLGATYKGYKGGDFVMDGDTPLWRADFGSMGQAIMRAEIEGEDLVLYCQDVDG